jgi:V/A-type H+-transporting ATPase subunit E
MSESAEPAVTSSGVQDLVRRIRDDGVKAGREEGDRILRQAKEEATRIVTEAKAEAEQMKAAARREIKTEQKSATEALNLAARDTILRLRSEVRAAFTRQLQRLISSTMHDREFIRSLILEIAGRSVPDDLLEKKTDILVPGSLFEIRDEGETAEKVRDFTLGIAADMLRDGIEIKTDPRLESGLVVRLEGEDLEIELTDETISQMLMTHILPRFRTILQGAEGTESS